MTKLEYRLAKQSDIVGLTDLFLSIHELNIGGDSPFLSPEELSDCIHNKKGVFLVCLQDKQIIGFIWGLRETSETVCITYLGVQKQFRKKGIGRSLVRKFVEKIDKFPLQRIYVMTTNKNARRFFSNCGLSPKAELTYQSNDITNIWRVV